MTSARARAIAASFSPSGTTPISRTWAFSEKLIVLRPKRASVAVGARLPLPAQEVVDHDRAALLGLDAAHVDDVVAEEVEPRRHLVDRHRRRPVDAGAHHLARQVRVAGHALDQLLLLRRVEDDRGGQPEELAEEAQVEDAVVLGGRDEQALVRRHLQPEVGRPVAVGEEDDRVVVLLVRAAGARRAPGVTGPCSSSQRPLLLVGVLEEADLVRHGEEASRPAARGRPGSAAP